MKSKLIFLIVFALFVQIANAQVFGIKGGLNDANISISSNGRSMTPKALIGFHVGPVVEFELKDNISINTGLLYSLKGFKMDANTIEMRTDAIEKINYLEVPLNVGYKHPINEKVKVFGQVGPYLAYALSAKDKSDGTTTDIPFEAGGLKRFDFGLGFGAGVEFGPLVAGLSYQLGLANIADTSEGTIKNKVLQISVAYMFRK